jgi:hypothetical protein
MSNKTKRKRSASSSPTKVIDLEDDIDAVEPEANGTYRRIEIYDRSGVIHRELCSANNGTPQKTLFNLARKCREYMFEILRSRGKAGYNGFTLGTVSGTQFLLYNGEQNGDFFGFLETAEREWQTLKSNKKRVDCFNALIDSVITVIAAKQGGFDHSMYAILWSYILMKGLSDISQYGAFLRFITRIPGIDLFMTKKQYPLLEIVIPKQSKGIIDYDYLTKEEYNEFLKRGFHEMCENVKFPEFIGVSSDLVQAAFMTNIAGLYGETPLSMLCTRKLKGSTSFIICQHNRVSCLASLISNTSIFNDLKQRFLGSADLTEEAVQRKFDKYFKYREDMLELGEESFMDCMTLLAKTPVKVGEKSHASDKRVRINELKGKRVIGKFIELCTFINSVTRRTHDNLDQIVEQSNEWASQDRDHIVERYAYVLANTVYKLLFPLDYRTDKSDPIAQQEFFSATWDSTYAHDYAGMDCIQRLGERYLQYAGRPLLPEGKKNEVACIAETLKNNRMATIIQSGTKFRVCFHAESNFIKRPELTMGEIVASSVNWALFQCPLSLSSTYYSIDFTVGLQPYANSKVRLSNELLKTMHGHAMPIHHPEFRVTYPKGLPNFIKKKIHEQNIDKGSIEIFTATSQFDGAAPYGLYPVTIPDDYISDTTFRTHRIVSQTHSNAVRNIDTFLEMDVITPLSSVIDNLTPQEKTKLENSTTKYVRRFDKIWKCKKLSVKVLRIKDYTSILKNLNPKSLHQFRELIEREDGFVVPSSVNQVWKKMPTLIDQLKRAFDELMSQILVLILRNKVAFKDELLDILEAAVCDSDEMGSRKTRKVSNDLQLTEQLKAKNSEVKNSTVFGLLGPPMMRTYQTFDRKARGSSVPSNVKPNPVEYSTSHKCPKKMDISKLENVIRQYVSSQSFYKEEDIESLKNKIIRWCNNEIAVSSETSMMFNTILDNYDTFMEE